MRIALFTSCGLGVALWDQIGTIGRELALYRKLTELGWEVHVFSFDKQAYISQLNGREEVRGLKLHACYPRWLPQRLSFLYAWMLPVIYWRIGRSMSILKTNQAHAAWHVLWAAFAWRKELVSRSGYVWGEQLENRKSEKWSLRNQWRAWLERCVMRYAVVCFVTTPELVEWCRARYGCRRLLSMPNNIDLELFKPLPGDHTHSLNKIIAVGRLHPCKRLDLLVRAMHGLKATLMLVGDGPSKIALQDEAKQEQVEIVLLGKVKNEALPSFLQQADVYVICSEYEGHPKALAEAMACGCVCVGTRSPGIINQLQDGINGLLCDGNEISLQQTLKRALLDNQLRQTVSTGARQYAQKFFSLDALAKKEDEILREVCG